MTVLHIITGLLQGGAEAVLYRLVAHQHDKKNSVVISLSDDGEYGKKLRDLGIALHCIGMPRGRPTLAGISRLRLLIREVDPDVIQTWMYHADLLGGLVAWLGGHRAIVWGIRNSNLDPSVASASARWSARICALLSAYIPRAIVSCSLRAAAVHQELGYAAEKFVFIPNGYDLTRFSCDVDSRQRLRIEWGVTEAELLIGLVARWDSQKDHPNLLRALAAIPPEFRVRCVLVGNRMDESNRDLLNLASDLGVRRRIILAGSRSDIPAVMNAVDLHVLPSQSEAFPNVVAEAMACGTPCVVTDVGDSRLLVEDTGWVVPPNNPKELAKAIVEALTAIKHSGRDSIGRRCRARIEQNFSLDRMARAYDALWARVQLLDDENHNGRRV